MTPDVILCLPPRRLDRGIFSRRLFGAAVEAGMTAGASSDAAEIAGDGFISEGSGGTLTASEMITGLVELSRSIP
jgi:hypothetical protein